MFITFEGPEGSGKTSQIAALATFLTAQGHQVLTTREPGGTRIGDQVRACLHDVANTEMAPAAEMLLYSASRAQLVAELIRPQLAAGTVILCDRFVDSTLAYQGYGRGLDLEALRLISQFATTNLTPDLTLLLDIDVERGLARRLSNHQEMNRLDLEKVSFHQRVRAGYHKLRQLEPERWVVVDADRPFAAIQQDLRTILQKHLPNP
ncbi:MAG: dTMP kinase [Ardenticatenaceae bacterium]|nr:dTMP kinase [Ardenticatenaceae bacterium]